MEVKNYKDEDYRTIFGVEKNTFDKMVEIIKAKYDIEHQNGGRKDGASPQERVEITLKYCRQYLSQRYIVHEYGVAKSCISPIIKWTLKILVKDYNFSLPKKTDNIFDKSEDRIDDATESRIDRPKKNQEDWYSGKKGMHTIKTQIEIGVKTLLIYSFIQLHLQKVVCMILNYLKTHHAIIIKILFYILIKDILVLKKYMQIV